MKIVLKNGMHNHSASVPCTTPFPTMHDLATRHLARNLIRKSYHQAHVCPRDKYKEIREG